MVWVDHTPVSTAYISGVHTCRHEIIIKRTLLNGIFYRKGSMILKNDNDAAVAVLTLIILIGLWVVAAWGVYGYMTMFGWLNPEHIGWLEFAWFMFLIRVLIIAGK